MIQGAVMTDTKTDGHKVKRYKCHVCEEFAVYRYYTEWGYPAGSRYFCENCGTAYGVDVENSCFKRDPANDFPMLKDRWLERSSVRQEGTP